jgi:hypothetical protein
MRARVSASTTALLRSSREDPALQPLVVALVAGVVLYAGLLRHDAAIQKYGPVSGIMVSEAAQLHVQALTSRLRPASFRWERSADPYAGGDPINYIRFARRMESFYAAHPREPGYVFSVKLFVGLLGGQDVGISYASAFYSLLLVWATYLLGAFACARWVGLAAALALASEHTVVSWSVDGWRDDAFAFFAVMSAYAILRLWQRPGWGRAVAAGVVAGAACLTRITSLSFIVPAMAMVVVFPWRRPASFRERGAAVAVAALVTIVLVGPYLYDCWRVYGDPLYSINFHTSFYRDRQDLAAEAPMSAAAYVGGMAGNAPLAFADTFLNGMTTYPFNNKWSGFGAWSPRLGAVLRLLSLAGMALFLWSPQGRFLLLFTAGSLLPYAFTWRIPGGSEWRFTMHVYPIFLIAAFWSVHVLVGFARRLSRDDFTYTRAEQRLLLGRVAATVALAGLLSAALAELPHRQVWEELRAGRGAHLRAGAGDGRYFVGGWYPPVSAPNVTARFNKPGRSRIRLPMLPGRDHRLTLRLHPYHYDGAPPQIVKVSLNGAPLAELELAWDPERVGSYEVDVPGELVRESNILDLEGSWTTRATVASFNRFAREGQEVGFMVWYVNVVPLARVAHRASAAGAERRVSTALRRGQSNGGRAAAGDATAGGTAAADAGTAHR